MSLTSRGMVIPQEWAFTFQPCCGLQRRIPQGTRIGEPFDLVPCPQCKAPFHGRAHLIPSDIDPTEQLTLTVESLPWPSPSISTSPKSSGSSDSSAPSQPTSRSTD